MVESDFDFYPDSEDFSPKNKRTTKFRDREVQESAAKLRPRRVKGEWGVVKLKPIIAARFRHLTSTLTGDRRWLVDSFLLHLGDLAVANKVRENIERYGGLDRTELDEVSQVLTGQFKNSNSEEKIGKLRSLASGLVFERLAFYHLKNQFDDRHLVADPGSTQRVMAKWRRKEDFPLSLPDSLIFQKRGGQLVLVGFAEFKLNYDKIPKVLAGQLESFERFKQSYGDDKISLGDSIIERTRRISQPQLKVDSGLLFYLALPADAGYEGFKDYQAVRVIKVPFARGEVVAMANQLLVDLANYHIHGSSRGS